MYVRFFVFVLANKKRCGKENEVIKPQASVPSLSQNETIVQQGVSDHITK